MLDINRINASTHSEDLEDNQQPGSHKHPRNGTSTKHRPHHRPQSKKVAPAMSQPMVLQQINILGQLLAYFILGYNRGDDSSYIRGSDRDAYVYITLRTALVVEMFVYCSTFLALGFREAFLNIRFFTNLTVVNTIILTTMLYAYLSLLVAWLWPLDHSLGCL